MPYKKPPKHTRFPVNRPPKPHTKKHPNGYFKPILNKLLEQGMTVRDDEVRKVFEMKSDTKAPLKKIVALRCILNAIQGDNVAIKELFERMDGKVAQELIGKLGGDTKIIIINPDGYKRKDRFADKTQGISS